MTSVEVAVTFEEYCAEWLLDVQAGHPSTQELGRRFSYKLVAQWLELDDASDTFDDLIYCDGTGDGGIDIAYLSHGASDNGTASQDATNANSEAERGDTWYLIQSKYGEAFRGTNTLVTESLKVIETLTGVRYRLSSLVESLAQRLKNFCQSASELDRLVLLFATVEPLTEEQQRSLAHIRAMGQAAIGRIFDVESISLANIFHRLSAAVPEQPRTVVPMTVEAVHSGEDLLIGSVSLIQLYSFLKAYRDAVGDLDQLYEKNIRRFLGPRGKVNKAMRRTILLSPERFGLYNNGITIVVENFVQNVDGILDLVEPYVVNGCQTTRTIWEVLQRQLAAGGTGPNVELDAWRSRAERGVVVTKIVKVGREGDDLLQDITRFTNSQNTIKEKDFIALTLDFRQWKRQMESRYNIFLELQRGGWESQRAYQRQHPEASQYTEYANAFELVKVYGSGWMGTIGAAFSGSDDFLPNRSIFTRIVQGNEAQLPITVDDLYAAYRLQCSADKFSFGRQAKKNSRRITRFLYYFIVIELIKGILSWGSRDQSPYHVTSTLLRLYEMEGQVLWQELVNNAIELLDEYFSDSSRNTVHSEPALGSKFNHNLIRFLKWDQVGRDEESSPHLRNLIEDYGRLMGRGVIAGAPSLRDKLLAFVV